MTKVEFKLLTGRRHQLRVHALCLNHPIFGDATYQVGDDSSKQTDLNVSRPPNVERMMLHSFRLRYVVQSS